MSQSTQFTDQLENEVTSNDVTYHKVKLLNQGSKRAKCLYDVDGNLLVDANGKLLNIWSKAMQDAFDSKCLRAIHAINPGYTYFITKQAQLSRFLEQRKIGSDRPNTVYCVYFDEDVDIWYKIDHEMSILSHD